VCVQRNQKALIGLNIVPKSEQNLVPEHNGREMEVVSE
jgi:hypothetical protein